MKEILFAVLVSAAFALLFEVKKPLFILCAGINGGVGWAVFLLLEPYVSAVVCSLAATIVVAVLAELLARILKAPATIFLVVSIMPMVPGGGLYYTMDHLISGDLAGFVQTGLQTIGIAGGIAVGVSFVSSVARLLRKGASAVR